MDEATDVAGLAVGVRFVTKIYILLKRTIYFVDRFYQTRQESKFSDY